MDSTEADSTAGSTEADSSGCSTEADSSVWGSTNAVNRSCSPIASSSQSQSSIDPSCTISSNRSQPGFTSVDELETAQYSTKRLISSSCSSNATFCAVAD